MPSVDYTKMHKRHSMEAKPTVDMHELEPGYWWLETNSDDRANRICTAAELLTQNAEDRQQANLRHARLYGNFDSVGLGIRNYTQSASIPQNKISLNVVAACVDTLQAKIAKNKPRPSFLTDGGAFKEQTQAKALDKFTRGWFYESKIYLEGAKVFRDGCIFDVGALHIYRDFDSGRVCVERVLPDELFVDDAEAVYGKPRQMFRRKFVSRDQVEAFAYGKDGKCDKEMLERIREAKPPQDAEQRGFGDVLEVWEAWHVPSKKGAGDGIHVIAIKGCELYSEEWTKEYFPFAFFKFSERTMGFWGQGLAERLSGIQLEINRLLRSVSEQLRRKGRGRIFAKIGSKVNPAHITNGIADLVFYTGDTPPVVDNANAVAAEEFMQLDRLYQRAFQEAGISELSAGAKKPSGLDAAVALREFNDIESERFIMVGKAYEQFYMDAAQIALDMIADSPGDYKVKLIGKHRTETLNWKDVDLDRDRYVMQMFPVSSLPQTPAYRYQRVKEMMADGFIDKATADRLLDLPDIEHENNLRTASLDDVDATIADILERPEPRLRPAEELQNLGLLLERATAAYLRVRHTDIEPERINLLITLIDQAKDLSLPPEPISPEAPLPGEPGPAGMGGMPVGPGGAPIAVNPTINMDVDPNFAPPVAPTAPPIVG